MRTEIQPEPRSLEVFTSAVVRPLTFVVLCGLLWGTLIAGSFFWQLLAGRGLGASAALFPDETSGVWAWVNLITALLATIAWVFAAATALASRSGGSRSR